MTDGTEQTTLGGPAAVREGGVPDWLLGGDGVVMSIGLLAALGLAGWAGHAWRRQLERRERHLGTLAVPLNRLTRAYLDCFTHLDAVPQVFEREKAYFLETRSDEGSPPDESGGEAMRAAEIDGFWRFVDQIYRHYGPAGALARSVGAGNMAFWIITVLAIYLTVAITGSGIPSVVGGH